MLKGKIGNFIKNKIQEISDKSDFSIDIMEVDNDHIHLLVDTEPKISPLSIIRKLKQITTTSVWKNYSSFLSKHFWKEKTFWSDGYFVCSCGDASTKTIVEYIRNQG